MEKRHIKSRAQALWAFARGLQGAGLTWVEANNLIYGPGGRFVKLFPTQTDRVAFAKTEESCKIDALIDSFPEPEVRSSRESYSGKFVVRVPKSLHAALTAEAAAEGVSLNQLVVAKLSVQLAGVVK